MNSKNKTEKTSISARPPVVVIMGHIDHGKSTLLDYIRKTNTTEKEAGGITQHISAYETEILVGKEKRKITFLDTPGHEAFSSIRLRSTKVADIAILVVSAEDGVKPQTLEALGCINDCSMPFIVALNKIDRAGANVDKVKQNLAENGVLVEGWGGTIPVVAISAKTGEGVPELLEIISLQSDLEELSGNPDIPAEGFVIESDLNPKQGISATLIIKNGTVKTGMFVAVEGSFTAIRSIENYKGENVPEASFSSPIRIFGWSAGPKAGSEFKTFLNKDDAIKFASEKTASKVTDNQKNISDSSAFFEVVIKADTFGSLDAVENELQKLASPKIAVKIISKEVGAISEKDIKTAKIKKSLVLGFNVNTDKGAEALAMRDGVEIKTYKVIYDLIDYVKEKIKENTPVETVEKTTGSAKIIRTFSVNKDKQVIGGKIEEGEIKSGGIVKIFRREALIGTGKIKELQIQKIKTDITKEGQEFGMMIESKIELTPGDTMRATSLIKQE
jgi:translation initiation factor IF-2